MKTQPRKPSGQNWTINWHLGEPTVEADAAGPYREKTLWWRWKNFLWLFFGIMP